MKNTFDFHFHLFFKHYMTEGFDQKDNVTTSGIAKILNEVMGGTFDSQSSPKQISESRLFVGVTSILSMEHAFVNRISKLAQTLPFRWSYVDKIKNGETSYYDDFIVQIEECLSAQAWVKGAPFNIDFLNRKDDAWKAKTLADIEADLIKAERRYFAFSIEGGHNLSNVPIHKNIPSLYPELQLRALQDRTDVDFISINLCHLSYIPEQPLGGFCQGLNKLTNLAFKSEDFCPKATLGITERGKKVIQQALTHQTKPVLIDVKHMSVYSRFHYYRIREKLITEFPEVSRLPVVTSHTGFCFRSLSEFITNKSFRSTTETSDGFTVTQIESENIRIGKTNDLINKGLFGNPWTINLFDEEITEIMRSNGMIGISLDQRILGAAGILPDSIRDPHFEGEIIAQPEWERMFRDGQLPTAERLLEGLAPSREERHAMILCLHLIHAVRVGYATLAWSGDSSPWDHLCIGSDFDGLINPINVVTNVTDVHTLRDHILQYLPQAEKTLPFYQDTKALKRLENGAIDRIYMEAVVDKFMFDNGVKFIARFLRNWS